MEVYLSLMLFLLIATLFISQSLFYVETESPKTIPTVNCILSPHRTTYLLPSLSLSFISRCPIPFVLGPMSTTAFAFAVTTITTLRHIVGVLPPPLLAAVENFPPIKSTSRGRTHFQNHSTSHL